MAKLGLAALVVQALRTAVTDPALVENVADVRAGMDELTTKVADLKEQLSANGALDVEQDAALDEINSELSALADALTGPADDENDTGVIGAVEPVVARNGVIDSRPVRSTLAAFRSERVRLSTPRSIWPRCSPLVSLLSSM